MESHSKLPRSAVKGGRREANATATRDAIVRAATTLFLDRGYQSTSIEAIAAEAGVAVQTIYNAIGGKAKIVYEVFFDAVAGQRSPVPPHVFLQEQAEQAAEGRQIIHLLVEFWREALPRVAPVMDVIHQAASLDPEIAGLERRTEDDRLANYEVPAKLIRKLGALRPGLSISSAAASMYAFGHLEMYRKLVIERGWTLNRYAAWIETSLVELLLTPAERSSRR